MRPKVQQMGILPELDGQQPADYSGTDTFLLARMVYQCVKDKGQNGATAEEVAKAMRKTTKSISGRLCELHSLGKLRKTEARRPGAVYVAISEN